MLALKNQSTLVTKSWNICLKSMPTAISKQIPWFSILFALVFPKQSERWMHFCKTLKKGETFANASFWHPFLLTKRIKREALPEMFFLLSSLSKSVSSVLTCILSWCSIDSYPEAFCCSVWKWLSLLKKIPWDPDTITVNCEKEVKNELIFLFLFLHCYFPNFSAEYFCAFVLCVYKEKSHDKIAILVLFS